MIFFSLLFLPLLHSRGADRGLGREFLRIDFLQKCSPTPSFTSLQMFACCSCSLACVWESLRPWLPDFPHVIYQLFVRYMLLKSIKICFFCQGPRQLFSGTLESSPDLHQLFSNGLVYISLNIWETCSKSLPMEDLKRTQVRRQSGEGHETQGAKTKKLWNFVA